MISKKEKQEKEKEQYLTQKDVEEALYYIQLVGDLCEERKKKEIENTIEEAFLTYGFKIIVNENCNVFLKCKF